MPKTMPFTNIAYYKFVSIEDPKACQQMIQDWCKPLGLRGTVILAREGINSCLAGTPKAIESFISLMRQDARFADIDFKKSESDTTPFRKMIVKIKAEIIPMGIETIQPAVRTGSYITPQELHTWFREKRSFILLDTRNQYEVELGTFRDAVNPGIDVFRQLPDWLRENFQEHKDKTIVTFCTGGIRCEKATAFMQQEGFQHVYQIQGGILKYLEETAALGDDNHYDGDCFVFDHRVAVDKNLQKAPYKLCFNCWHTLTPPDMLHPHYKADTHCHFCFEEYQNRERRREETRLRNDRKALAVRKARSDAFRASSST